MAQIVRTPKNSLNESFTPGGSIDFANFTTAILTGAGWILCFFQGVVLEASGSANLISMQFKIDGIGRSESVKYITMPISGYVSVDLMLAIRLGAGQHTFLLNGTTTAGAATLLANIGAMTIWEPGY